MRFRSWKAALVQPELHVALSIFSLIFWCVPFSIFGNKNEPQNIYILLMALWIALIGILGVISIALKKEP
jgi:branched-subunit amino acid transport protein AzlD